MLHNELTLWEKISFFPATASIVVKDYAKQFIEGFIKDEDGLEVVQTVLVVLVGVLLIAALWAVIQIWLGDLWAIITNEGTIDTPPSW